MTLKIGQSRQYRSQQVKLNGGYHKVWKILLQSIQDNTNVQVKQVQNVSIISLENMPQNQK